MRLVMLGTGTFAEPTFEKLLAAFPGDVVGVVTQPDRDAGNKRGSTRQTGKGMAAIAAAAGVPVIQPTSINAPDGLAGLRAFAPDLCVVAAYGQILKPDVIATPTLGMINVHASLLPRFRGAAPVAHAILAGETHTGVTIIRITPGLDAGDMLAKTSVEIRPDETAGELESRIAPIGAELAVDVVRRMMAGPVTGTQQDPALVTKAPKLTKEMGLIDWSQPAERVVRQVYAMQPWPTAYTFFLRHGKEPMRVQILRTQVGSSIHMTAPHRPGSVFRMADPESGSPWYIGVVTGQGTVFVLSLQPAGKKPMTATEFLRGYPIQDGYRFGPEGSS